MIAELPPPHPAAVTIAPEIARRIVAAKTLASVRRFGRGVELRLAPSASTTSRMTARVSLEATRRTGNGFERGTLKNGRIPLEPPLVVTDTINGEALPFAI